jgi:hypothetical protein
MGGGGDHTCLKTNSIDEKEKLVTGPRWWMTPGQTGRLPTGCKKTLTFALVQFAGMLMWDILSGERSDL